MYVVPVDSYTPRHHQFFFEVAKYSLDPEFTEYDEKFVLTIKDK